MRTITALLLAAAMFASTGPARAANIVETAQSAGQFGTLLAAAEAAGLVETLSEGGPLTVFAPTDDAFDALPDGTVERLLRPENKAQLVAVLSYHVLPRRLTSNMLPHKRIHVRTVKRGGDRTLAVSKSRRGVRVDNARVVSADIRADNGVIHVIDKVLLPSR